jgi:ATP-dependent Clp protease ATP-binding subunit ClpB
MAIPRNLTIKTQEALQDAHNIAQENSNQELSPLHLLSSLLNQEDSIVIPLLQKLNVNKDVLRESVTSEINKLPKVSTVSADQVFASRDLVKVLEKAGDTASKMNDQFVSVEHLFLSLLQVTSPAQKVLVEANLDYEQIKKTLESLRGPHNVTDENPEGKYQALEKYSIDLTARAREGKLDPVIGRDEEIRRVMQVLSRRTKNNQVLI